MGTGFARRYLRLGSRIGFALAASLGAASARAAPAAPVTATVAAASSLSEVLEDARAAFARQSGAVAVTLTFGSSGALKKQIEEGAPIDVFVSASPAEVDALESAKKLREGTRTVLGANRLVLVAPAGSRLGGVGELAAGSVRHVAMGDPGSVPAGRYAEEALAKLGLWAKLAGKRVLAKDVRQVLAYVESGNADAGFVYATDARKAGEKVRIVETLSDRLHSPIVYPGALVASERKEAGTVGLAFLAFLRAPAGQAIFRKHGFEPAPERGR